MNRRTYIDWLRGLAVVIMIEAHTLDSWTRSSRGLALSTAQFTEQTLTVNQLVLASMLDWLAEEGVSNEADYHRIRTDQALDRIAQSEAAAARPAAAASWWWWAE